MLFVSSFFFSSIRRHTRCALVTGVQTCALPIFAARALHPGAPLAPGGQLRRSRAAAPTARRSTHHGYVAAMSTPAEHYRKLSGEMAGRIAAVPDDRWGDPAPCEGWTARDVVKHLVETPPMFFGLVDAPAPVGGPSVDEDPLGAFEHMAAGVQAALRSEEHTSELQSLMRNSY